MNLAAHVKESQLLSLSVMVRLQYEKVIGDQEFKARFEKWKREREAEIDRDRRKAAETLEKAEKK